MPPTTELEPTIGLSAYGAAQRHHRDDRCERGNPGKSTTGRPSSSKLPKRGRALLGTRKVIEAEKGDRLGEGIQASMGPRSFERGRM